MRYVLLTSWLCLAACAHSPADATREGIALELAHGGEGFDRFAVADRYEDACLRGHAGACWHFERLMTATRPHAALYHRELARWKPRCQGGEARACFRWGLLYDSEDGLGLEPSRACELYRRACHGGYAYACQRAAALHYVRAGPEISAIETRQLTRRSCDAGYGRACVVLADLTKLGKGGPRDLPRSRQLLRLACRRGQSGACVRLAKRTLWLARGKPPPVEAVKADLNPLYESLGPSCRAGHSPACNLLLRVAMAPLPAPDNGRAAELQALLKAQRPKQVELRRQRLEFLCHDGDVGACRALAMGLRSGYFGRRDFDAARDAEVKLRENRRRDAELASGYLQGRCGDGSHRACFAMVHALRTARFGLNDPEGAKRFRQDGERLAKLDGERRFVAYREACDERDDAFACLMVAKAFTSGGLVPKDLGKARTYRKRHDALVRKLREAWTAKERE